MIHGEALAVLQTLPDSHVDCVVTSPPYWSQRDYMMRSQLGMESTADEYIEKLVEIFAYVWPVLKPEGTLFVNLGDVYGGNVGGAQGKNGQFAGRGVTGSRVKARRPGAKCLMQIPSRFAIAMVDAGWILRNEIIWHKPNCMPESVKDRFTTDHEKVFFFTKKKQYYFDQQAILEPLSPATHARMSQNIEDQTGSARANGGTRAARPMKTVGRKFDPEKRNKRTVWRIPTIGFKEAHFATFPPLLIEPMIKAGCPQGGVVLDPFFGAGTTGLVAAMNKRKYIGIDINKDYLEIAKRRLGLLYEQG